MYLTGEYIRLAKLDGVRVDRIRIYFCKELSFNLM